MRKTEPISTTGAASLRFLYNTAFGRICLKPLVSKPVSVVAGWFLDKRVSKCLIKRFIKNNGIDMLDYEERKFNSFNDFFTRSLKSGARPLNEEPLSVVSPCDARVTAFKIDRDSTFNIKGTDYTVAELLENEELAKDFVGGSVLIFRLAVDNYHRYSFVADGEAEASVKIKGKYHTVQPIAMKTTPIFKQNAREYTVLNSDLFGKIVQVEVGALLVGRIANHRLIGRVKKGQEKGKFEFGGSTVVVLFEPDKVVLQEEFFENTQKELETHVKHGEKIGVAYAKLKNT